MFAKRYAKYYDVLNQRKCYNKEIKFVHRWAEKPKSIFDIGCGTASYWKYFPTWVSLVGIDKSRAMARREELPCGDIRRNVIIGDITKYQSRQKFECATALFDVLNYVPRLDWFKNIPLKKGGYFIFDIWDQRKVQWEGFKTTCRNDGGVYRLIYPRNFNGHSVELNLVVASPVEFFSEVHKMYVHSHEDIKRACGKDFELVAVKQTTSWQKWYKLKRK